MNDTVSGELVSIAIENTRDGIIITDAENRIQFVNRAFTAVTGYPAGEAIGHTPTLLSSGYHDKDFYREMWGQLLETGRWQGNIWSRRKNGEVYLENLAIVTIRDKEGQICNHIGTFVDIKNVLRDLGRLQQPAQFESLIDVPDRIQLQSWLNEMTRETDQDNLLAVIVIDLDDFKSLNDNHGHPTGNRLLAITTQRLMKIARSEDLVGRLGGDEFFLMLRNFNNRDEVEQMADRILKIIGQPCDIDGRRYQVTASLGATIFPHDNSDADTLLRHADQAMYTAKESGRSRYHIFDSERDQQAQTRRQLLNRLAQGLEQNELLLHYQPKVNLRTGQLIGVEALLRWQHPEDGFMPPASFLPHAEHNDLIIEIGDWVARQALAQIAEWNGLGLNIPISINVAARQLLKNDFVDRVKEILAEFPDTPNGSLEMEILESAALENTGHVRNVIEQCGDLGIKFALDDFGTGYASLAYLRDIPADILKIDRSFVCNILENRDDMTLIEGAIGLGAAFQRIIIAEGVETAEQGVLLMRLGCDIAQGYGIAKPMPAQEMPDWVTSYQPDPQWALWADTNWEMKDFPLLVAQYDHLKWVRRVLLHVDGAALQLPQQEFSDHRLCRFGHWYYGHGMTHYGDVKAFRDLEPTHIAVHKLGAKIVSLCDTGKEGDAEQKSKELLELKDEIIDKLMSLQQNVVNNSSLFSSELPQ